ncbi:prepilin peptidase [Microbacterium paludicola]|uniref:prepilin peptidase n=1 Tax=Microbacterium paludicola TaxID=300019 RepID=UPI003879DC83
MTALRSTPARLGAVVGAAVVAGAALGFAGGALRWIALAAFVLVGVALAVVDVREQRLPDLLTLPLAAFLAALVWVAAIVGDGIPMAVVATLTALGFALILFLMGLAGGLGLGDVKLGLSIGLLLGLFSWHLTPVALLAACILALPQAIVGLIRRRRHPDAPGDLAFGPYLVGGTLLVMAWVLVSALQD